MGILTQIKNSLVATLTPSQGLSDDDKQCVQVSVYYFELTIPGTSYARSTDTFLVPLVLNPTAMSLSEPFAVQATPTQGAGLYVERNGIMQRSLRIRGTTGWALQPFTGSAGALGSLDKKTKDWSRELPVTVSHPLSGQKHFQYLQDAVFRTYSDFVKNANTAAGTQLIFRNPRDQEDWLVEPRSFTLERSARNPLSYDYDIDLLVLGSVDAIALKSQAPDASLLDKLRDTLTMVSSYADVAQAYVRQVNATVTDLRRVVTQIDAILFNYGNVLTAVASFLSGATQLIESPFTIVQALSFDLEDALNVINTARQAGHEVPEVVRRSLMHLQDAAHNLAMFPALYQSPTQLRLQNLKALQAYEDALSQAAIASAAAATDPKSFAQMQKLGTSISSADAALAQAQIALSEPLINYTGVQRYQVQRGDTLANLAARYLGDAKRWLYIAAVNDLTPPYAQAQATTPLIGGFSTGALAGLTLGSTISIPDFSDPPTAQASASVLGALPTAPVEEQVLGVDLAMGSNDLDVGTTRYEQQGSLLDLLVDHDSGGTDIRVARGTANLSQAVLLRLGTEKGTDTLYPQVGIAPLLSTGLQSVDSQTAQYIVRSAILQDPRVAQVVSLSTQPGSGADSLLLTGVLKPTSSADPVAVAVTL